MVIGLLHYKTKLRDMNESLRVLEAISIHVSNHFSLNVFLYQVIKELFKLHALIIHMGQLMDLFIVLIHLPHYKKNRLHVHNHFPSNIDRLYN